MTHSPRGTNWAYVCINISLQTVSASSSGIARGINNFVSRGFRAISNPKGVSSNQRYIWLHHHRRWHFKMNLEWTNQMTIYTRNFLFTYVIGIGMHSNLYHCFFLRWPHACPLTLICKRLSLWLHQRELYSKQHLLLFSVMWGDFERPLEHSESWNVFVQC